MHSYIPILYLAPVLGVLGHLQSQNDVITSRLRLTATPNCFPHPYKTYTKCLSTLICCPSAYNNSLTQFYSFTWLRCWGSGSLVDQNDVITSRLRLTATLKCLPYPYKTYTKKVFEHIDICDVAVASLGWYLCSCCKAVFTVVELAPCHCAITFIKMALLPSLN